MPRFSNAWLVTLALATCLLYSSSTTAGVIRFSTSGSFDLASRTVELNGVNDADGDSGLLGTIPVEGISGPLGDAPFHLRFQFSNGLPAIDVTGTISSIGYNSDLPVLGPVVTTSATDAQLGLYPTAFQELISHPDWFHTTSFSGGLPTMALNMSVHVEDPNKIRPIPEPSSIVVFATVFLGIGLQARRMRK